ncbi:DMSO/selenate family reductase complex B subunit [Shewanella sp. GXUN23E]|uniref:DMSO/selenate family reductase complex B subunit n=1 Tax=Shewanella sp. GXUN23E TaxID=3422498 RepID=UPI003D7D8DC0
MENSTIQYGFYLDASKCSGCKTCQVACKDRSNMIVGPKWRRVYEYTGGSWQQNPNGTFTQDIFACYLALSCNHCNNPKCVQACPTGAMHKDRQTGLVRVFEESCIGCEACARACPYDAPQIHPERRVMTKCDGCYDRLKQGLAPVCVASCPQRALEFGPIDELRARYGNQADAPGLPSSAITDPNLVITRHPRSRNGGQIINTSEI